MPVEPFGRRLRVVMASHGQLCVGIDPHPHLLDEWGMPDTAAGVREFGIRVVEAAAGRVGIVKPQVAFFERHGSAGYAALETVLRRAREASLLVIADVKRGDLGTSVDAYGQAWLEPGSPLESDAMTVSAYQGVGSLTGLFTQARTAGKGAFVLTATSNPEALALQTARIEEGEHSGKSVTAGIVEEVMAINEQEGEPLGSVGIVLGATVFASDYGVSIEELSGRTATPVLAPGFGFQGATFTQLRERYGSATPNVVATTSRAVLSSGPHGISNAIDRAAGELAECLA